MGGLAPQDTRSRGSAQLQPPAAAQGQPHSALEQLASALEPSASKMTQAGKRPAFGKRRRYLVDPRLQLRAGLMAATVVLILLLLLNLSLHAIRQKKTAQLLVQVPEFEVVLRSQDRVELSLVMLASIVFLFGVFAVTVLETHRTAGALVNLRKRLKDVELGCYSARLRLRRTDNQRELEAAFDGMSRALQERAWQQVEALEELAAQLEALSSPQQARELAVKLHALADRERRLAD